MKKMKKKIYHFLKIEQNTKNDERKDLNDSRKLKEKNKKKKTWKEKNDKNKQEKEKEKELKIEK